MATTTYNMINTVDTDKILKEKGSVVKVFMYLTKRCYGYKNRCCPSQFTISKDLNVCVKTVQRAIKRLIDIKLIERKRRQQNSNIYIILNKPIKNNIQENQEAKKVANEIKDKCKKYSKKDATKKKATTSTKNTNNWINSDEVDSFNNFEQREYNYDELEKDLLGWR